MFSTIAALCLLPLCLSQVLIEAPCPRPLLQPGFDVTRYTGKWYESQSYEFGQSGNGKCVTAEYTPLEDGVIEVNNTVFEFADEEFRSAIGTAEILDPEKPAELCVRFSRPECGDYNVVSTDYTTYTLVHACADIGLRSLQVNWILTREANPDPNLIEDVLALAESVGIPRVHFDPTVQDCGN